MKKHFDGKRGKNAGIVKSREEQQHMQRVQVEKTNPGHLSDKAINLM